MSWQWIIDYAEQITINRKPVVASTTARDGTTRAVSRGNASWKFDVKLPDGIPWTQLRSYISSAELLDRHTPSTFKFNNTGHEWLVKYQGDYQDTSIVAATWSSGSNIIGVQGGVIANGFKFRAGDLIQFNAGRFVYTVAEDVPDTQTIVKLHRPVLETSGSSGIKVGADCEFKVLCVTFPDWTLMSRDQVSWGGAFTFVEDFL
jgi:hypothetical protein